jgi:DNA polymerase III alpha subunit
MYYLNLRTEYSFRTAYGRLAKVLDLGTKDGQTHVGVADRSSTFGHIGLQKYCDKKGVSPIFGVELGVVGDLVEKRPTPNWMTFLARNEKGLKEIYELVALATSQFAYIPRLDYNNVHDLSDNVVVMVGQLPAKDKIEARENFVFNLAPSSNVGMAKYAEEGGFRTVACADNFFPRPQDDQLYEVLVGRNASIQTWAQWIVDDDTFLMCWPFGDKAIAEAEVLARECNAALSPGRMLVPPKPKSLFEMCSEGALRLGVDLEDPVYRDRLDHELETINAKEFQDYFYIIADIVNFAKQRMLVGPARGSSCGSLVCYLLGITTVDPIPFGLIFERFIDVNRADLPDIDIDFNDEKRDQVFEYMARTYKPEHVARLGTISMYGAKSALNETAAALRVPQWEIDKLRLGLLTRPIGHPRAHRILEDTFETEIGEETLIKHPELILAAEIEGHARHYSQHAAGMLVTESDVTTHVAVDKRNNSTMCDKRGAEDLNLLKIDALGLKQLSIIEDCLSMMRYPREWIFEQPLDVPAAFDVLNDHKFAGIFQFQGQALQNLTRQVKVAEFNDIVALTALARPGPLMSGAAAEWVDRRNGDTAVPQHHKLLSAIVEETHGVIIYQEQIMRLGREIGNMDWPMVSKLRKAISKSMGGDALEEFHKQFEAGAKENGLKKDLIDALWDTVLQHGSYSFNKSHAVAYAYISYWCCLLKSMAPVEFACASIRREDNDEAVINMLREVREEGILHIPFDRELSGTQWEVHEGKLLGPLTGVHGVGPKIAEAIVDWRGRGELPPRAEKILSTATTPWDELYPISKNFRHIFEEPFKHNVVSKINFTSDITDQEENWSNWVLMGTVSEMLKRDHNTSFLVEKRGFVMSGQTLFLDLTINDDKGSIPATVRRKHFAGAGTKLLEEGNLNNAVWLFAGSVNSGYRRLNVERVRLLGYLKEGSDNE